MLEWPGSAVHVLAAGTSVPFTWVSLWLISASSSGPAVRPQWLTAKLYASIVDMSTFDRENGVVDRERDTEGFQAWVNLLQAQVVVVEALEERLQAQSGLSLAEHETLVRLAESPEGYRRMAELAGLLLVSKSGGTRLVDRLVAAGLVARESCATDRRGTYAVLTAAGRGALDPGTPVVRTAPGETVPPHLPHADAPGLPRLLRKLLEADA